MEFDPFALPTKLPQEEQDKLPYTGLPQGSKTLYSVIFKIPLTAILLFSLAIYPLKIKTFQSKKAFTRTLFKQVWIPLGITGYFDLYMKRKSNLKEIYDNFEITDPSVGSKDIEKMLWKEKQYVLIFKEIYKNKLNQVLEIEKHNLKQKPLPSLLPANLIKKPEPEQKELSPEELKEQEFAQKEILKEKNYMDAFFIDLNDILEEVEGTEISFIHKK